MNILFVTHIAPAENGIGAQQRCRNHINALKHLGNVTVLRATGVAIATESDEHFRSLGVPTLDLACRFYAPSARRGSELLAAARWESAHHYVYPANELAQVRTALDTQKFDLIMCFKLPSYVLARQLGLARPDRSSRLLVDFDDVESVALLRQTRRSWRDLGMESTAARLVTAARTRLLEAEILRRANAVSVCSELDRQRLAGHRATSVVLPNVYEDPGILPWSDDHAAPKILFVGAMSYPPNQDATLFFMREIVPLIRARLQRPFIFEIVGKGASDEVINLAARTPEARVVGFVPSLRPHYATADMVVVPIRFGGGTRIKILEALAFGRAIVTTTLGAEGLGLTPNEDALFADDAAGFASACVSLIQDEGLRRSLVSSGRRTYERAYSSAAAVQAMNNTAHTMGLES